MINNQDLVNQLRWRYAVKAFDASRKLSRETWSALEQALVLSPSSYGLQPWRFIVITDPALKAELPSISWGQNQPRDCSHMVVLAALRSMNEAYVDEFIHSMATIRGVEKTSLEGLRGMILKTASQSSDAVLAWNTRQVYIALGQLMTAAAMLGVDTCPMEGIESQAYDRILGLDDGPYTTIVGCAVGYRDPTDKYALVKKVRFDTERVVQRI